MKTTPRTGESILGARRNFDELDTISRHCTILQAGGIMPAGNYKDIDEVLAVHDKNYDALCSQFDEHYWGEYSGFMEDQRAARYAFIGVIPGNLASQAGLIDIEGLQMFYESKIVKAIYGGLHMIVKAGIGTIENTYAWEDFMNMDENYFTQTRAELSTAEEIREHEETFAEWQVEKKFYKTKPISKRLKPYKAEVQAILTSHDPKWRKLKLWLEQCVVISKHKIRDYTGYYYEYVTDNDWIAFQDMFCIIWSADDHMGSAYDSVMDMYSQSGSLPEIIMNKLVITAENGIEVDTRKRDITTLCDAINYVFQEGIYEFLPVQKIPD